MSRIRRPALAEWRDWDWEDYLAYFLSVDAAKKRAQRKERSVLSFLKSKDFYAFCEPIRQRLEAKFGGHSPLVSIQLPARNEEIELLATLVSYTLLDVENGLAEIIVADNASTDGTQEVIRACGAKYAFAPEPGMGKARRAAYEAMSPSAQYVWLTDCDARTISPLNRKIEIARVSTILRTNLTCMFARSDVIALSTGIVYEWTHPLFRLLRAIAVATGRAPGIHCWTGPNQFVRRSALDAIGGIHPDIPYRSREDHQRVYELARYAKTIKANMLAAGDNPDLIDPVYHSGRRRGTLRDIFTLIKKGRHRPQLPKDKYGFPVHPLDRIRAG
jgi:glycosyltransferase involved in cell wall biosynthesis